jgi:hypothetical protein
VNVGGCVAAVVVLLDCDQSRPRAASLCLEAHRHLKMQWLIIIIIIMLPIKP